ncbi:HAMP domain-containing sensor histidine kinase [Leptolyngbya sp. BC1307]|uniref:sensor histidine kinase n=1 Tax=Leptolyngbya sp. BC1307 TaxID=2029589 RepID=UPI000EFAA667|nr:HAMP domain-containing sensor histidine kinase [Leptolyngbya sp. BC1307]
MSVADQLLPTISALVALGEFAQDDHLSNAAEVSTVSSGLPSAAKQQRAEHEWQGAIAALNQLLTQQTSGQRASCQPKTSIFSRTKPTQALLISGPVPLLSDPGMISQISSWTFAPQSPEQLAAFSALSPVGRLFQQKFQKQSSAAHLLPLLEDDPLAEERFAFVLTPEFSLVLVLGKDADDELRFQFSFMPQVVDSVWRVLRSRIRLARPQQLDFIDPLVEKFAPRDPHYRTVSQFNRWMLACLPQPSQPASQLDHAFAQAAANTDERDRPSRTNSQTNGQNNNQTNGQNNSQVSDSELLKAMAHEIRTPLTTIRTYTRSLLKRKNLDSQVIKRLNSIDRECTQQIDRFSLIFRAVELEAASQTPKSPLSAIALHQVFQEAIPQWQQAAHRRNLSLEVGLPPELPMVASDPTMLQHVLTGLVELFTHSVSPGSHIQLHVLDAGDQLKLQFQSQANPDQKRASAACSPPPLQSLGHLLMFQPETGGLSLNLEATKNLFHALGAKLTVRERFNQGTIWTVFLPLEASGLKSYPIV